ncbi:unannotated protein [freshwater metagenome]|uniref:Unannotated protein n=1 Tax=freshwater metagenome TaxID=449393 RepID=A0A6J6FP02_9ZZZZ|nr:hypothetical protein [Actinomycetota bacterium]
MANNESQNSSPRVSKLPLPISDSPLVIDLPDGQKIVLGKMVQGSVIEVATWRGVGRPDSRTSRLMLGMGSGNVNEESNQGESQSSSVTNPKPAPKPAGFAGVIFTVRRFITNFNRIKWTSTFKALLASLSAKKTKKSKKRAMVTGAEIATPVVTGVTPGVTVSRASDDADIEAWLNSITAKAGRESAKSSKSSTPAKAATTTRAKSKTPVKKSATKPKSTRRS